MRFRVVGLGCVYAWEATPSLHCGGDICTTVRPTVGRGARRDAPKAIEVVKMVPVVAEPDSHVVSETEATFDESDTDDEELFDDSEEDDDEPRAVTTGRVTPSPIPAAERAAEAMFGEATFDESEDEKSAFEDSGDEDEAPLP